MKHLYSSPDFIYPSIPQLPLDQHCPHRDGQRPLTHRDQWLVLMSQPAGSLCSGLIAPPSYHGFCDVAPHLPTHTHTMAHLVFILLQMFLGRLTRCHHQGLTGPGHLWAVVVICASHMNLSMSVPSSLLCTFFLKNTLSISDRSSRLETQGHPLLTPTPALDRSCSLHLRHSTSSL